MLRETFTILNSTSASRQRGEHVAFLYSNAFAANLGLSIIADRISFERKILD